MTSRLAQLEAQAADLLQRAETLPGDLERAETAFVEAVRVDADPAVIEAFRVQCTALYEAKLDLITERAANERAQIQETGRGPR